MKASLTASESKDAKDRDIMCRNMLNINYTLTWIDSSFLSIVRTCLGDI